MKGGTVHNNHHFTGKKGKNKQNNRKSRNRMRKKRVHVNKYEAQK